jgi:ABC-2 type transport system ATP-binding protein
LLKEDADVLRTNTYAVSGPEQEVTDFIRNKKVLQRKQLAGMMTAYVYGDMEEAKQAGLSVEGVPIQELMIYLTENKDMGA